MERTGAAATRGSAEGGVHRLAAKDSAEDLKAPPDDPKPVRWMRLARAIWLLWVPFFRDSATRRKAWALTSSTVALIASSVWVTLQASEQVNFMTTAINEKDPDGFWGAMMGLACICLGIAPIMFAQRLTAGTLALEWRRSLTNKLLARYISSSQAFYRLKMQDPDVDNPDQRIAQDVGEFTKTAVFLLEHFTQDIGTVITSTWTVYLISPDACYVMLAFSILYTLVMLKGFASPLMRIQRRVLGLEADLRYLLMRLRENAESVAFFQGAHVERELSEVSLVRVLRALYTKLYVESGFACFQGIMVHSSSFATFIPLAPLYFNGGLSFGAMSQAHMLLMGIERSMFDFTKNLDQIAGLGAQALRIMELWDAVECYERARCPAREEDEETKVDAGETSNDEVWVDIGGGWDSDVQVVDLSDIRKERLIVSNLTLLPPFGASPLLHELSFTMREEDSVLISGPSGTGKSTLLRTIGGLYARGSGRIHRTALRRSFFVPQSPYLYEGSLRQNVMYPASVTELSAAERAEQDGRIRRVLDSLGIGYLASRHGLDEGAEFDKMLSGGEKQRLNFARALVREDVSFVLLDEATSALDEANESVAYDALRRAVRCYVSVGHRGNLRKFHTKQLTLEKAPEGGCEACLVDL